MEHFGLRGCRGLIFSKRVGNWGPTDYRKGKKIVQNERPVVISGNFLAENDARRSRNVMEPLRTPKTARKNKMNDKRTETHRKKKFPLLQPPALDYLI